MHFFLIKIESKILRSKFTHTKTMVTKFSNSARLNKVLRLIRFKILLLPLFFLLVYFLLKLFPIFEWKSGLGITLGSILGTLLIILFRERKTNHIYEMELNELEIRFLLVSFLGETEKKTLTLNEIEKIKCRKVNIFIHLKDSVEEYFFTDDTMGANLSNKLNSEQYSTSFLML